MTKIEKVVFNQDGSKLETITLEVSSEFTTVTLVNAKNGETVKLTFPNPTADALYELLSLARPTHDGGQPY